MRILKTAAGMRTRTLAALLCIVGCMADAQSTIDITAQIRQAAADVVITGSASSASYMPTKAFDGSIAESGRWLGAMPFPPANIDYHIPADWEPGKAICVTSYIVHRLPSGTYYNVERMPTSFTLSGSNDGGLTWAELDSRSGVDWSAASSNVYVVALPTPYRSYRFTALASNATDSYPVGVGELTFLGDVAETSESLMVTAIPSGVGVPVPGYGSTNGLASGDTFVCSVPSPALNASGSIRYVCTGSVLETLGSSGWENPVTNAGTSRVYVHGVQNARLTWLWKEDGYTLAVSGTVPGRESVNVVPADEFVSPGTTVTVTAVPAALGALESVFLRWEGDVPAGMATNNPLTLVMDRSRTLNAVFKRGWDYIPGSPQLITDGDWCLSVTGTDALTIVDVVTNGAHGLVDLRMPIAGSRFVTAIGGRAFISCAALTDIVLPETLTHIMQDAFYACSNLRRVEPLLPGGLIHLGYDSFGNCGSLEGDLVITNAGLSEIGNVAFRFNAKITSVNMAGSSITNITGTFSSCSSITNVWLPEKLETLGTDAFYACSSLRRVEPLLPGGLIHLGYDSFGNCGSLEGDLVATNPGLAKIERSAFRFDAKITSVDLSGSGVKAIEQSAFLACSGITNVWLSDCVESLGYDAFCDCIRLERVEPFLPPTIASLSGPFDKCGKLVGNLSLVGAPVATLPAYFCRYTKITSVDMTGSSVALICGKAFGYCTALTNVVFSSCLTNVENDAFSSLGALKTLSFSGAPPSFGAAPFKNLGHLQVSVFAPRGNAAWEAWASSNVLAVTSEELTLYTNAYPNARLPLGTCSLPGYTTTTRQWYLNWVPPGDRIRTTLVILR